VETLEYTGAMEIDHNLGDQPTEAVTGERDGDGDESQNSESEEDEDEGTQRYRQLCGTLNKKLVSCLTVGKT
jgi:hypothetical protein